MAVTFDANSSANGRQGAGTTFDFTNLTVGSGTNRALVVQLQFGTNPGTISVANWDQTGTPQALTEIPNTAADSAGGVSTRLFGLVNPTSGNKTLRFTWTTDTEIFVNAVSWTGVDQTGGATSFPNGTNATGNSASASVTVTSAVGNAVMGVFGNGNGITSVNNTQTFLDNSGINCAGGNRADGAASVALTATLTSDKWAASGTDIAAAGGGSVTWLPVVQTVQGKSWVAVDSGFNPSIK